VDPEAGVDDGGGVRPGAHLARPRRVVDREGEMAEGALPVGVGVEGNVAAAGHGRGEGPRAEAPERRGVGDLVRDADALDERLDVLAVREVVGLDDGVVQGVPALEADPATAPGPQQQRQDGPRLGVHQRLVHGVVHAVP